MVEAAPVGEGGRGAEPRVAGREVRDGAVETRQRERSLNNEVWKSTNRILQMGLREPLDAKQCGLLSHFAVEGEYKDTAGDSLRCHFPCQGLRD